MMEAKIIKIGNSCGVRIPASELERLGKSEGDLISIKIVSDEELERESMEKKKKDFVVDSKMSKGLALLIVNDFDNNCRGFDVRQAQGFLGVGLKLVNRLIGEGLSRNFLFRAQCGRRSLYHCSFEGKKIAFDILGGPTLQERITRKCGVCGGIFSKFRYLECPHCREKRMGGELKKTETEVRASIKSQLGVHKIPPSGNPVLKEECRSLAVPDGSNLPVGIVLPERKPVPSCAVERCSVGGGTILRSDDLNKRYYAARDVEDRNRELIAAFKVDLFKKIPPQQYDEYKAVCDILFINDVTFAGQEYWSGRADVVLKKNSKILPAFRSKSEKIERVKQQARKISASFFAFKEAAEKNSVGN